jgi:hypothetical protein
VFKLKIVFYLALSARSVISVLSGFSGDHALGKQPFQVSAGLTGLVIRFIPGWILEI